MGSRATSDRPKNPFLLQGLLIERIGVALLLPRRAG